MLKRRTTSQRVGVTHLFGSHLVHLFVDVVAASKPGQRVPGEFLVVAVEQQELGRLGAEGQRQQLKTRRRCVGSAKTGNTLAT